MTTTGYTAREPLSSPLAGAFLVSQPNTRYDADNTDPFPLSQRTCSPASPARQTCDFLCTLYNRLKQRQCRRSPLKKTLQKMCEIVQNHSTLNNNYTTV